MGLSEVPSTQAAVVDDGSIRRAAAAQVCAGVINLLLTGWITSVVYGSVGGIVSGVCTCGTFPVGGLCGLLGCLLPVIGLFELASGAAGLLDPQRWKALVGFTARLEIASVVLVGVPSLIAGLIAMTALRGRGDTAHSTRSKRPT